MTNESNITEFPTSIPTMATITLDSVVKAMENWRRTKKTAQEPIPDFIWQQIFVLLEQFPESTLRAATGISNTQFRRKLAERSGEVVAEKMSAPPAVDFCEVKANQPTVTPLYKPAKIPATNTLVVEFCRGDGRIMKIHTTTDSFAELMKAFFEGV